MENIENYVSTTTVIVKSNILLDIQSIFNILPITYYEIQKKKRGRQKKIPIEISSNTILKNGDIISVSLKDRIRGIETQKNRLNNKLQINKTHETNIHKKYFRNAMTVVMFIGKLLNFKISSNGNFQITGSKNIEDAKECILFFFFYIHSFTNMYSFNTEYNDITNKNGLYLMFKTVMTNIVFKLGFNVNREILDHYIIKETPWNSLFETSLGYTGVNIKVPITNMNEYTIYSLNCMIQSTVTDINIFKQMWTNKLFTYQELNEMNDIYKKLYKNGKNKNPKNTFLVFQSGSVIMSGIHLSLMKDTYYKFIEFIEHIENNIKEKK